MGKHRWPTVGDTAAPETTPFPAGRAPAAPEDPAPAAPEDPALDAALDAAPLPLRHDPAVQPGVQWRVARSAALVFLGVALAVGSALFLVRSSEPSAAAITVLLDDDGSGESAPGATDGSAGGGAPPVDSPSGEGTGSAWPSSASTSTATGPVSGDTAVGEIVVYVTGAVASPGVVTVVAGTRLFEVIDRAGGPLPDADLEEINLAASPSDGEHIHLLAVGEEPRPGITAAGAPGRPQVGQGSGQLIVPDGGGGAGSTSTATIIDINTATLAEIELLPRVGPVLGQRIIDWREEHGPFRQASDIDAVPGIGPAMLEGILPLIAVR